MFVWCPGPEAGAGGGPLSCAGPGLRAGSREAPGQWRGGRASAAVVGLQLPPPSQCNVPPLCPSQIIVERALSVCPRGRAVSHCHTRHPAHPGPVLQ